MQISAKTDYALRALVELAAQGTTMTLDGLARAQGIPPKYLSAVLIELRHRGFVLSYQGPRGGYQIKDAEIITVAEVIRAISGPLVSVRGKPVHELAYDDPVAALSRVWTALQEVTEELLEGISIADIVNKRLPPMSRLPITQVR